MSDDRGPYLTRSRALALERQIAATEARVNARLDQIERQTLDTAQLPLTVVRALAIALVDVLKEHGGGR